MNNKGLNSQFCHFETFGCTTNNTKIFSTKKNCTYHSSHLFPHQNLKKDKFDNKVTIIIYNYNNSSGKSYASRMILSSNYNQHSFYNDI